MRATASPVEGNLVRLSVEMDEDEVNLAVRQTVRRLSGEIRVPGFRPGKVPRQVLEARLGGASVLREQAIRDAMPDMYAQAVVDTEVDPIATPEIDIVSGTEKGPVTFDAVVEVRPTVAIPGYGGLVVTLPNLEVTDEDIDAQVDRLREQFGELVQVGRPARTGDHLTIDLRGTRPGQDDLHVEDYLYEIGSGTDIPGLDEELTGSVPGDIIEFPTTLPSVGDSQLETLVKVLVKDVKQKNLPEATDEWASEASEFDTIDALRNDMRAQLSRVRIAQARMAMNERAISALVGLVEDDIPGSLVEAEVEERIHDLAHQLERSHTTVEQFLRASGQDADALVASLRVGAQRSVKADLALRALADAEDLQVSDEEIDEYLVEMAERANLDVKTAKDRIDRSGRLPAIRSEQRKAKAVSWLLEHVELVDENGNPIDRTALQVGTDTEVDGDVPQFSAQEDDEVDGVDKEDSEMGTAR
jgi:trigger factor